MTRLTTAIILLATLFVAASASAQGPARWSFGPPDRSTPPTCFSWQEGDFFERASAELVRDCLQAGTDPHAPVGHAPAIISAARTTTDPAAINFLTGAGADPNVRMRGGLRLDARPGRTPLHEAAAYASDPETIELLVATGADVNTRDSFGYTPLHSTVWYHHRPEIATALIAAGADGKARDPDGYVPSGREANDRTPLFMSVYRGGTFIGGQPMPTRRNARVVEVLVRAGADLERKDGSGRTALHAATLHTPVAFPLLLRLGADPTSRDVNGRTPLDYVLENRALEGLPEVRRMREAMRRGRGER